VEKVVQVPSGASRWSRPNYWSREAGARRRCRIEWKRRARRVALRPRRSMLASIAAHRAQARGRRGRSQERRCRRRARLRQEALEAQYDGPLSGPCSMERSTAPCELGGQPLRDLDRHPVLDAEQAVAANDRAAFRRSSVSIQTPFLAAVRPPERTHATDFVSERSTWRRRPTCREWTTRTNPGRILPAAVPAPDRGGQWTATACPWREAQHRGPVVLAGTRSRKMMVKDGIDEASVEGVRTRLSRPNRGEAASRCTRRRGGEVPVPGGARWENTHHGVRRDGEHDRRAGLVPARPGGVPRQPAQALAPPPARRCSWRRRRRAGSSLRRRGRARGVAVHESFGASSRQVAEVSVDPDKSIQVHKGPAAWTVHRGHRWASRRRSRRIRYGLSAC